MYNLSSRSGIGYVVNKKDIVTILLDEDAREVYRFCTNIEKICDLFKEVMEKSQHLFDTDYISVFKKIGELNYSDRK